LVQKTFAQAIGTNGEKVLRVVIDQTGRIVTAFPADRLMTIGLGAGALGLFGERTAAASEKAHGYVAADEKAESAVSWVDFVPIIGDIWGGELNKGEDEYLRRERELEKDIADTIASIEATEQRTLGAEQRKVVAETFRAAVGAAMIAEIGDEAIVE
jgi:hypothetical protein